MSWHPKSRSSLPIDAVLSEICSALDSSTRLLLAAPPGAGKTTRVPLAIMTEGWASAGRILLLEPRRLAARAAAQRLAEELDSSVGDLVGLRMRGTNKTSRHMRIEVVTEGVLTRQIQHDPSLEGISAVIFDEVHERHLVTDLGLALVLEAASALRPDLRVIAMSATLDTERFARLMEPAALVVSEGRQFPLEVRWRKRPDPWRLSDAVAREAAALLAEGPGSVLAFLPGRSEISRAVSALKATGLTHVYPLHAGVDAKARRLALQDGTKPRIIVSTSVAESSVTVEGVQAVVDGGLARRPSFHRSSGLSRLVTTQVSEAEATQRAGRAARLGAGRVVRLWSELEHSRLHATAPPEIDAVDLSGLVMELSAWGSTADNLRWPSDPPAEALRAGVELLQDLAAMDTTGRLTELGRAAGQLGMHPRLGVMLAGAPKRDRQLACEIAALLERGSFDEEDLSQEVARLRSGRGDREAAAQVKRLAKRIGAKGSSSVDGAGAVLQLGYPDRVARARSGQSAEYLMVNGRAVTLQGGLGGAEFIVVADTSGRPGEPLDRVRSAAALDASEFAGIVERHGEITDDVHWDNRAGDVIADQVTRLGAIVVKRSPLSNPPAELVQIALLDGVQKRGLAVLGWSKMATRLRARLGFCHEAMADAGWPAVDDETLLAELDEWLLPFLGRARRLSDLSKVDLVTALRSRVPANQLHLLDELAPDRLDLGQGEKRTLRYEPGVAPTVSIRLQEALGWQQNPTLANGRAVVRLELLNPAQRPLHITSDLSGFWDGAYAQVRGEMLGRYPKHYWPKDPRETPPPGAIHRPRRR